MASYDLNNTEHYNHLDYCKTCQTGIKPEMVDDWKNCVKRGI